MAVIVLYGRSPSESQSLCSLLEFIQSSPSRARYFSLIIYDNSPQRHSFEPPIGPSVVYRHDPSNPGLAAAYNFALAQAEENQEKWLLLLDQDTSPSLTYWTELIACVGTLNAQQQVGVIVPKLVENGKLLSPEAHFIDQIRHQYRDSSSPVSRSLAGVQENRLVAYNSGATFRVSALRSIGGFPEEFWLDYLDHAVAHALFVAGYRMYVMQTKIEHEPSQGKLSDVPAWRQRNILSAQTLFVKQAGNFWDRLLYRIWVLRYSRALWSRHPDRSLSREAALHAITLKTLKSKRQNHRP